MTHSRFTSRLAADGQDISKIHALRRKAFSNVSAAILVSDQRDQTCEHVMIESDSGDLCATFRMEIFPEPALISQSYSAGFYDLRKLRKFPGALLEISRFCADPEMKNPDILRLAFGSLINIVDTKGVELIFGCSSFWGSDTADFKNALCQLGTHHTAPAKWAPLRKAQDAHNFASELRGCSFNTLAAFKEMPQLLRGYLSLGAWVSDHIVRDHELGSLHVFTGVEVGQIPEKRMRAIRALVSM